MAWLHTWAGLVLGWVLFFVFVTGTLSYVRFEIDRWMMPEKPMVSPAGTARDTVPRALSYLAEHGADAQSWTIILPRRRTYEEIVVWWSPRSPGGERGSASLNAETGLPDTAKVRDTGGGGHFFEMHYSLHYIPYETAIRIVGLCAMAMLAALITGIVVHKKIFRDFFTFRPGKGQRSWLDAHNLLGVAALPFHVMICWSGLVLFLFTYMPAAPALIHGDNGERVMEESFPSFFPGALLMAPASATAPISPMIETFERRRPMDMLGSVTVNAPGQTNAEVILRPMGHEQVSLEHDSMTFSGATGALLRDARPALSTAAQTHDMLLGLHMGDFAGPVLRAFYVLAGFASSAMIATGLVLWTAKRRQKQAAHLGFRLVEALNIGTIAGLPIAIAAYFWANRLLPLNMADREHWEVHVMFLAWAAMLIWPIWRSPRWAWFELLGLAALAFGLLPVLNALTTDRHLAATIPAGDWVLAGFDLIALVVGIVFAAIAIRLRRRAATVSARRFEGRAASNTDVRDRLSVASRTVAGVASGYVLTSLFVVLVPLALPQMQSATMLWSSMVSFFLYAATLMAVFHARSPTRAWLWIIGTSAPLTMLVVILLSGTAA
ncbi:MAG: PepSY-associated TM helix domain-containing protein [Novosphingobium sp.]